MFGPLGNVFSNVQGQTFEHVGVYLPRPVFSHGQLYVALSRCGESAGIKVLVAHEPLDDAPVDGQVYTRNIVFIEAFSALRRA